MSSAGIAKYQNMINRLWDYRDKKFAKLDWSDIAKLHLHTFFDQHEGFDAAKKKKYKNNSDKQMSG